MSAPHFNDPGATTHADPAVVAWLEKAVQDLQLAEHLLNDQVHFDAICFHSQQAAEKVLKAMIYRSGVMPPKIHDLANLDEIVRKVAPGWAFPVRELADLSAAAVDSRYPGYNATLAQALEAFRIASAVWSALRPLL
jgi:HEPN domain-containing protein